MPTAGPGAHAPAATLATRTYLGLLAAQFLAAFNDQAIHAAAMFFAINTHTLSEGAAIAWMPVLFYAPWALFCTLAGYLADRYSKRSTLVAWKVAEVGICLRAVVASEGWAGIWIRCRSRLFSQGRFGREPSCGTSPPLRSGTARSSV